MKHSLSEPRLIKTDALAVRRLCVRPRDLGCPCSSTEPRAPLLSTRLQWWSTPMSKNIRGISASWRRRRSQGSLGVGSALRDSPYARTTISDDAPKFRDGRGVILGIIRMGSCARQCGSTYLISRLSLDLTSRLSFNTTVFHTVLSARPVLKAVCQFWLKSLAAPGN